LNLPSYNRRTLAKKVREDAAEIAFLRIHQNHIANGEELKYTKNNRPSYITNFSKGLSHDSDGDPNPDSYESLQRALTTRNHIDFENIIIGFPSNFNKFHNPQGGLAFDLESPDSFSLTIPPAPRINSLENAGEIIELYWMAKLRDINFAAFGDPSSADYGDTGGIPPGSLSASDQNLIQQAIADLNSFGDEFKGPKDSSGNVTAATLFRGFIPGDLIGPYLSQFLILNVPFGTIEYEQKQKIVKPGKDYLIDFNDWLNVQNGDNSPRLDDEVEKQDGSFIKLKDISPTSKISDFKIRHIINGRDISYYVHFDALYEAYLNACLIMINMGIPVDPNNPYTHSRTQTGFVNFREPHILTLVTEVATRALKAVWFQKWFVHCRLRPEAFGGIIHNVKVNGSSYILHKDVRDIIQNEILTKNIFNSNPSLSLLPQAFPEGSPPHPAYGAGHATVAGACVTMLKAWFDESFTLPSDKVKVPNKDGTSLIPYTGSGNDELTVIGELNKVAANIAIGRNWGGVHWRSDYTESLKLGEAVAIGILEEQKNTYNENASFSLTKFDGTAITI
jgi:hypothetical protein